MPVESGVVVSCHLKARALGSSVGGTLTTGYIAGMASASSLATTYFLAKGTSGNIVRCATYDVSDAAVELRLESLDGAILASIAVGTEQLASVSDRVSQWRSILRAGGFVDVHTQPEARHS